MKIVSKLAMTSFILGVAWLVLGRKAEADARVADRTSRQGSGDELEARLQAALKSSFPASDPFSVGTPTAQSPDRPVHRQPAEIDKQSVDHQAELLDEKRRQMKP